MSEQDGGFGFKFKIGDEVMFMVAKREADAINAERTKYTMAIPQRLIVVMRELDECYGGVQRKYRMRGAAAVGSMEIYTCVASSAGADGLLQGSEPELMLYEAPIVKKREE